jgi:hypothetical protein
MSSMSSVSYDYATKTLTINKTMFDLNLYSADPAKLKENRNKISTISIGDTQISSFYNGDTNEYKTINVSNENDFSDARISLIEKILTDLKTVSKEFVKKTTGNANVNVLSIDESIFTNFLSIVMLTTKIFTGVLILQKVGQATCEWKPTKQDELVELENKIKNLKDFLQQTSSLLFKMETISPNI